MAGRINDQQSTAAQVVPVPRTRFLCFSGAGFNDKARSAADSGEVQLIDLPALYGY